MHSLSNNGLTQKGLLDVADTLRTCDNVCGVEIRWVCAEGKRVNKVLLCEKKKKTQRDV